MKQIVGRKNKNHSIWLSMGIGVAASMILTVIGCVLGTSLINSGKLSEASYPVISAVIWCLASFIGSWIASMMAGQQFLIVSAVTVFGYLLLLTAIQILLFDSQFDEIWKGILLCIAGMLPTILICSRAGGSKKAKIKYRRI